MLNLLLKEIDEAGSIDVRKLATRLGTTPALISMMLEELERQGKLVCIQDACAAQGSSSPCGSCPVSTSCLPRSGQRTWARHTPA